MRSTKDSIKDAIKVCPSAFRLSALGLYFILPTNRFNRVIASLIFSMLVA
jgi:hypothetical protein